MSILSVIHALHFIIPLVQSSLFIACSSFYHCPYLVQFSQDASQIYVLLFSLLFITEVQTFSRFTFPFTFLNVWPFTQQEAVLDGSISTGTRSQRRPAHGWWEGACSGAAGPCGEVRLEGAASEHTSVARELGLRPERAQPRSDLVKVGSLQKP